MTNESPLSKNWFEQGGEGYARYRPEYPAGLAEFLARFAPGRTLAVDVGCGTGQLTNLLAAHFDQVLGADPSAGQIAHAMPSPRIKYVDAPAEHLPVADSSASLITAAQAAHWFDLPGFYKEVRRIGCKQAAIALVSYGVLELDEALNARFDRFYRSEIGPYWPAQRKLVDSGYADIAFPFDEHPAPKLEIRKDWNLNELLGYVSTWSAVRKAREARRENILTQFAADLGALWGNPANRRPMRWPINMRLGTL